MAVFGEATRGREGGGIFLLMGVFLANICGTFGKYIKSATELNFFPQRMVWDMHVVAMHKGEHIGSENPVRLAMSGVQ